MDSVWKTLSTIDCKEYVEQKGNLSYLSWAWAWGITKQHFPSANYEMLPHETYPDGTVMVRCNVSIEGMTHQMWLPVMNYKNQAVSNPDAFAINTAMMRCLTKCLAMFGLGHYIYAGEDVPKADTTELFDQLLAVLDDDDVFAFFEFNDSLTQVERNNAFNSAPPQQKTKYKNQWRERETQAVATLKDVYEAITEAIENDDDAGFFENVDGMGEYTKKRLRALMSADQRKQAGIFTARRQPTEED